jgi:hypothetical protein
VQTTNAGNYSVVITNNAGSATSTVATLTVYVPPAITNQPQSQALLLGQDASFSVGASGTAPLNYQWSFNGTNISGATNTSLTFTNVQTTDAGNYSVTVYNFYGSVTSAVATLTINIAPAITTQPQSQTVVAGQTVSLSVVASGTAPLSYRWKFNGTNISGATNTSLTLTNLQTTNAGSYTVVVTNIAGSVTSAVATLTVNTKPVITSQPQSQAVPLGQTAAFSVGASGIAPLRYRWSFNGTALAGATNASLTLTNVQTTNAGNYSVVITNNAGSATSTVATLTVYVPPAITNQPQSQALMLGQDASFSVGASGTAPLNYQWSFNGTNISGATNTSLTFTNVQTTDAGNYSVTVYNFYGSVTSTVATLTVYVPPTIARQPQSQALIMGQTAAFSVGASGTAPLDYQWSFNGTNISGATNTSLTFTNVQTTDAGNYSVTVYNFYGSVTSTVATLTVYVPPTIASQPQSQALMLGQDASFSVGASGTATLNYQWYFNGSSLNGDSKQSTLTVKYVTTNDVGNYTVVVSNSWGSATSAVATLTVYVPPAITNQPQSQALIMGQTAAFSVGASGTAPLNYQWSFNGTNLSYATNASLTLTNIQTTNAGNYSVVITNIAGSVTSAVASLTVTNPVVTLSLSGGAEMTADGFAFQLWVPAGCTYVILASTNNQDWTPIATNVALTASVVFTDTTATNYSMRFYRAMVQ